MILGDKSDSIGYLETRKSFQRLSIIQIQGIRAWIREEGKKYIVENMISEVEKKDLFFLNFYKF